MYKKYKEIYWQLALKYEPIVLAALRGQLKDFADDIESNTNAYPWNITDGGITQVLIDIHSESGVLWAKETKRDLQRQGVKFPEKKSFDVTDSDFFEWVVDYFKTYLLDKSVIDITNTTRKEILLLMEQAIENGWGAEKLAREIRNSGIAIIRARAIARTEVGRAMNTGAMIAAVSGNSATRKKWVSARDNRTRRLNRDEFDHLSMDGVFAEYDEPFVVPGKNGNEAIDYPQSPTGSAGNVINCRCMNTFKVVRDQAGNILTPEQHNPSIVNNGFYKTVNKPRVIQIQ